MFCFLVYLPDGWCMNGGTMGWPPQKIKGYKRYQHSSMLLTAKQSPPFQYHFKVHRGWIHIFVPANYLSPSKGNYNATWALAPLGRSSQDQCPAIPRSLSHSSDSSGKWNAPGFYLHAINKYRIIMDNIWIHVSSTRTAEHYKQLLEVPKLNGYVMSILLVFQFLFLVLATVLRVGLDDQIRVHPEGLFESVRCYLWWNRHPKFQWIQDTPNPCQHSCLIVQFRFSLFYIFCDTVRSWQGCGNMYYMSPQASLEAQSELWQFPSRIKLSDIS